MSRQHSNLRVITVSFVLVVSLLFSPFLESQRAYAAPLTSVSHIPWTSTVSATGKHTTKFTTATVVPANGKILITFPAGFNVSGATFDSWSGFDGGRTVTVAGQVVTITRDNTGTPAAAGAKYIVLDNITNHATAGTTYTVTVETQDNLGATLDGPTVSGTFSINAAGMGLANSPWPVSGYNAKHQGRSPFTAIPNYATIKWASFGMTSAPSSPVIGGDGTIYSGEHDGVPVGKMYAINPTDGTKKWEYSTGHYRVAGYAVGANGTIYVSGADRWLHALNPANGTQYWQGSIGQNWTPTPIVAPDGTIYAGLGWSDHRVFAYNPDGTLKMISTDGTSGHSGATVVADGTIYVGHGTGLYAINPDGSTKWSYPVGGRVDSTPTVGDDGTIYFGASTSSFYALNSNGTLKWSYATGTSVRGTAAIGADGTIYVGSDNCVLYAFNPDGTLKWSYGTETWFRFGFVSIDAGGTIYVQPAGNQSKVYALNSNGTLKWSYNPGGGTSDSHAPAVGDGVLYIPGGSLKKVIALRPWTLSALNPSGTYLPGSTMTITATTSMLQTDPSNPGENNQVQAVMANGDKVPLSYSSTNANGDTVWTGTWTVPANTPAGAYTATIEAAAYNVQTDTTVHFNSAPTGSNNTGITNTFSYSCDQQVNAATGTGTVTFTISNGTITGLTSMLPSSVVCSPRADLSFPNGLFSYNIINVTPGSSATVTLTFPSAMPVGTQYWKCINGQWVNVTSLLGDDDGDNILTLTLTDGGLGDADGLANGTIVDPGGPIAPALPQEQIDDSSYGESHSTTLRSAAMKVRYLKVTPQQAYTNQPVVVTTNVINDGGDGSYNVMLRINGQVEQTRAVSVSGGSAKQVKFTVAKSQPGTYTVQIGNEKSMFTVIAGDKVSEGAPMNEGVIVLILFGALLLATVVVLLLAFRRPA